MVYVYPFGLSYPYPPLLVLFLMLSGYARVTRVNDSLVSDGAGLERHQGEKVIIN